MSQSSAFNESSDSRNNHDSEFSFFGESASRIDSFRKVEFWGALTLFAFILFSFITEGVGIDKGHLQIETRREFGAAGMSFSYYGNYFFPQLFRYLTLFTSFLYLNFIVIPEITRRQSVSLNIVILAAVLSLATIIFGITGTYLNADLFGYGHARQETYNLIFLNSFLHVCRLMLLMGFYTVLKYACVYVFINVDKIQLRYRAVTRGGLIAFIVWSILLFLFVVGQAEGALILAWLVVIPVGILLYWYSFATLIPSAITKKRPFLIYLLRALGMLVIASVVLMMLLMLFIHNEDFSASLVGANLLFQVFITIPLSWVLFKRHLKGNEELYALKTELGQSHANLDFLRSQINPHFLFNALNTLYGTAIQEKAEKTSEGVQRLGDMMRFMLQENLQDKIPLARETEYLNNYISLQKLRTDAIPMVTIEANIEETSQPVQIAPMLLIPFVENAFKHGISFREPSPVKIGFELRDNVVFFDVSNNKHKRHDNDPEKDKSGIGLKNVKQRLQHMYPGRHELIIRETSKEFFVHLTLRLTR